MNCYMNIPQCAEQAERIRQTLEALSRAHERIVETLRQLEDQTCPETIDALRRMESSPICVPKRSGCTGRFAPCPSATRKRRRQSERQSSRFRWEKGRRAQQDEQPHRK